MNIKESSEVTLYSGVDITSGVQIVFKTKENQSIYFDKKILTSATVKSKFNYVRRTGKIKIGITTADAAKCDYMRFINPAFENKLFYAKILNYEYINNNTTEIQYAVDYFQTYMFDVKYEEGLIEREHLSASDYQKSVEDPYRMDVYELTTPEDFRVSKETEEIYKSGTVNDILENSDSDVGVANFPDNIGYSNSCIIMEIADFDTSALTDIETAFYSKFDIIINSSGIVIKDLYSETIPERPEAIPIKIGRGYGIYVIGGTTLAKLSDLSDAIDWLTYHNLDSQMIGNPFQISSSAWNAYFYHEVQYGTKILYTYPRTYNVRNKKLLRFPYQYLRLYNNEGDCKEYKYEFFKDRILSGGKKLPDVKFMYAVMLDGNPVVSVIPFNYRKDGPNQEERIDIRQIPQIGYTSDAYLAFLASRYTMDIASRTDSLSEDLNSMIDNRARSVARDNGGAAGTDPLLSAANTLKSSGSALLSLFKGDVAGAVNEAGSISASSIREESAVWSSGGNYVYSGLFAPAEAAYAADKYHAGSSNGTLGYYLSPSIPGVVANYKYAPGNVTMERVKQRDQVLAVYDRYLNGYGYASFRYGTPRVCAYMQDNTESSSPGNEPDFAPFFGKNVTYVKTSNMHVTHIIADVSSAIEDMFNTGCQFLKGEDL